MRGVALYGIDVFLVEMSSLVITYKYGLVEIRHRHQMTVADDRQLMTVN